MQLFYQEDLANNQLIILNEDESRHCAQVLRKKEGDIIYITDGLGHLFHAKLTAVNQKKCCAQIIETITSEPPKARLHIAIAPTKNMDRIEWFVEKAVEIGISEITPIICNRSERRIIKTERIQKVAISAMKQSIKTTLPIINDAIDLKKLQTLKLPSNKYICYGESLPHQNMQNSYQASSDALFLIGPEGDFTPEEIKFCVGKEFKPIYLGSSRLRTETAALYVTNIFNFMNDSSTLK